MAFDEYTSNQSVKAEQITEQRSVITPNGPMAAAPGQWEVRFPDGNVQVVDDEQFNAAFGKGETKEKDEDMRYPDETTPSPESELTTDSESEAVEDDSEEESETKSEPKQAEVKGPTKPRSSSR